MERADVVIVGAGISGTALSYVLSAFTDIPRVVIIDKHDAVAQVSSHHTQNSQTLHYGDIETNYTLDKAKRTAAGARLVQAYLERLAPLGAFSKKHKMVIGVGPDECAALRSRFDEFRVLFPELRLLDRSAVADAEPLVVEGRDRDEEIIALWSPNGFAVDYGLLAEDFLSRAKKAAGKRLSVLVSEEVRSLRSEEGFVIETDRRTLHARSLVVDAGAMSIYLAKRLGYAEQLSILSVAGNFYRTDRRLVNGKVYTVQLEKLPFAAPHADPDVHDDSYTRFGPSAKPLLMLERWNYGSVNEYLRSFVWNRQGIAAALRIITDRIYLPYMLKNILYDVPIIGARLFARSVKKIIPSLKASEIRKDRGYGGSRPQIVNTESREISMGEARIVGDGCIFNITPSPGASICLANAERDARLVTKWLGASFDDARFDRALR